MTNQSPSKSMLSRVLNGGKQIAIMLVVFTLFSAAIDLWRSRDIVTDNLPDLKAMTLTGDSIDILAMSHQEPVLLYFWGTWCPVCSFVSPSVDIMATQYSVVTVAMSSGNNEKLAQYLQHKQYEFPVVNDDKGLLSHDWSVNLTPTLMVIKDGELQFYTSGFTSLPGMWWRMLLA
ncbi:protein disulfide oxidoreductase [Shewanella sp. KX20019]|uniref:protein disulfide oxidoreductase n=1 Tax=Shewanella sp. KX20019 TaxID=2803864 RepID=UPI0019289DD6|nr:protein disulfide oxidoreductase [Shewanella sp. KX20019]QQX81366.1 protein disulfide oxidoreductase [Shewanella sp. KX20019]